MASSNDALRLENEFLKLQLESKDTQLRKTTLDEYLTAWHEAYQATFAIEKNQAWLTSGTIPKPTNKICPMKLRKWNDFPNSRASAFRGFSNLISSTLGSNAQLFMSKNSLTENVANLSSRPIASEADLLSFREHTIEDPLRAAIQAMTQIDELILPAKAEHGIAFSHHSNLMKDPSLSKTDTDQKHISADRFCYATLTNGSYGLITVVEQKPPHKLSLSMLDAGLFEMELDEVINETKISNDEDARFKASATQAVAATLSQAYAYMVEGGLEYGCVETGEATVFLRVLEGDVQTLYYHLAIPSREVKSLDGEINDTSLTSLGQFLGFFWMAVQSTPREQNTIVTTLQQAKRWTTSPSQILSQMTPEKLEAESSPSIYKSSRSTWMSSLSHAMKLRVRKKIVTDSCKDEDEPLAEREEDSDSDSRSHSKQHETPIRKSQHAKGGKSQKQQEAREKQQSHQTQQRHCHLGVSQLRLDDDQHLLLPYCTQKCLLGLITTSRFDELCPNIDLHRNGTTSRKHLLNHSTFCSAVKDQLAKDLQNGLTNLHIEGARGLLFKVSLLSHGYRFVAKGTCKAYVPYLEHEARVYCRLRPLQGDMIPVHLGSIDLVFPWVRIGLYVVHMLLLSWGGESIYWDSSHREEEHDRIIQKMIQLGVKHMDVRRPNMLWDKAAERPMVIDFERSEVTAKLSIKTKLLQGRPWN